MKKIWIAALLLLASCTHKPTEAEIAAHDDAVCRSYGLTYGTSQYADCRQRIVSERQANARAALGAYLQMQRPVYQTPVYQVPVPTTTTCNQVVGYVTCQTH